MGKRWSRWWGALRRPSATWSLGALLLIGSLATITVGVGGGAFIDYSNTLGFCTSCHEMRAFVYEEYKGTPHARSASGVRAICADCHVPKAFVPKMLRKIRATLNEVPKHFLGTIDTPEEFEARRPALAEHVWAEMRADDSQACRNCHDRDAMLLAAQKPRARGQHEDALKSGETCIDCHKGIAHELPPDVEPAAAEGDEDFSL
jgi:nitrate/TMAO reductase-like tetraheme cytochrome c subunit